MERAGPMVWDHPPEVIGEAGPAHVRFSRTELLHLLAGSVALAIALAMVMKANGHKIPSALEMVAALIAVATGFVLHELAHKIVAQGYGHWAEFRARFGFLALTLALAFPPFNILVAAPGAVYIRGAVTIRQNGLISLVGPGLNIVLAAAAYPLTLAVDPSKPLPTIAMAVAQLNAGLGVFNLIPISPFDGRKVLRWSKTAYAITVVAALGVLALIILRP